MLVPLLVTVFSSFKTTKDIMNHFFGLPNPFTLSNYERLVSDGIEAISGIQLLLRCYH